MKENSFRERKFLFSKKGKRKRGEKRERENREFPSNKESHLRSPEAHPGQPRVRACCRGHRVATSAIAARRTTTVYYWMASNCTSKTSVALGGMMGGYPCSPYAYSGLHIRRARWPSDICSNASSQPTRRHDKYIYFDIVHPTIQLRYN